MWILGLTRRRLPGEPGLWREGPHGVKSLCSLLAVIPSGENTRDAPDMQEEAQAQGQRTGGIRRLR